MINETGKLKFNSRIYSQKTIQAAVYAYRDFAKFKVIEARGYFIVKIEYLERKFKKILAHEFSNYVLGLTKRCL